MFSTKSHPPRCRYTPVVAIATEMTGAIGVRSVTDPLMVLKTRDARVAGIEDVTATSFSAHLPYDSTAAARARQLVSELVTRCRPSEDLTADAALVVHELVINGLIHGAPDEHNRIEVSGRIAGDELVISVVDQGDRGTVAALPFTDDSTHGRGLSIVATLSSSWTVDRSAGTRVSARLPLW